MPEPEAVRAAERFRVALLNLDAAAARSMIDVYGPIFARLEADATALLASVEGQTIPLQKALRLNRMRQLSVFIEGELARFAEAAGETITLSQRAAVELAQRSARVTANLALPEGITLQTLAASGIPWNVLPTGAVEQFVGIAGDGAPLGDLLARLGPEMRATVTQTLAESIATGRNPRVTARLLRRQMGMGLTRALRISRTETLRAFRESTRMAYAANPVTVRGYTRRSAQNEETCFACISLDGKFYPVNEPLDEHVNGRCVLIPVSPTYRQLGLDVPEAARPPLPSSREWFNGQTPRVQSRMMGKAKFEAWTDGQFELEDMARIVPSATWGPAAVERSLKDLIGG